LLDNFGENVAEQDVALLNARGNVRRHAQTKINNGIEFAAGAAGEGGRVQAHFLGEGGSMNYVKRIAAGGYGDGNVAGAAKGFDLAGEDAAESMVVRDGGHRRKIGGEGERGKCGTIKSEAADELRGDVLCVHGAPTIAEEENLVALGEGVDQ